MVAEQPYCSVFDAAKEPECRKGEAVVYQHGALGKVPMIISGGMGPREEPSPFPPWRAALSLVNEVRLFINEEHRDLPVFVWLVRGGIPITAQGSGIVGDIIEELNAALAAGECDCSPRVLREVDCGSCKMFLQKNTVPLPELPVAKDPPAS